MWVKRTPEELAEKLDKNKIQQKNRRIRWAIGAGIFALINFTFTNPRTHSKLNYLVSVDEIPRHLLVSVPVSLLSGLLAYGLNLGVERKRFVICPKCGTSKNADSVNVCACGGKFEDMDTMKWEENTTSE